MTLVLALVDVFLVVRHTRADESAGRADLVRAAPVGRATAVLVAVSVASAVNLLFGLGALGALVALGEPWGGSVAFALSVAGGAFVFATIAVLAAQAFATSRSANAAASLVAVLAYLAFALGNADSDLDSLAIATPFGWVSRARPFAGERWWLVALSYVVAAALLAVGLAIATRREVGATWLRARAGTVHAGRWLRSAFMLGWRVERGQLATWIVAMVLLGGFVGYIAKTASDLLTANPQLARFLDRIGGEEGVADSYVLVMIGVLSFATAAYAVSTILRVHADEQSGRLELLLSLPISRTGVLGSRALLVLGGTIVLQLAVGLGVGITNGLANQDVLHLVARYVAVAVMALPAIWILLGVAVAVVGAVPRLPWLAWLAFAYCVAVGELGSILGLPDWVQRTTPFWFTPRWPAEDFVVLPIVVLIALAVALAAFGVARFRVRDVPC